MPLSYVDNCADAIILAGSVAGINGEVFNILDSELCTCNDYMRLYLKNVRKMKNIRMPYYLFWLFSWLLEKCAAYSNGRIPPAFNPYKTAAIWKKIRFDNAKLVKKLGWSQTIPTSQGLIKHFGYFKKMHTE